MQTTNHSVCVLLGKIKISIWTKDGEAKRFLRMFQNDVTMRGSAPFGLFLGPFCILYIRFTAHLCGAWAIKPYNISENLISVLREGILL
jgi:hypothetical protein